MNSCFFNSFARKRLKPDRVEEVRGASGYRPYASLADRFPARVGRIGKYYGSHGEPGLLACPRRLGAFSVASRKGFVYKCQNRV